MKVSVNEYLKSFTQDHPEILDQERMQFPNIELETENIKILMISETVPENPDSKINCR